MDYHKTLYKHSRSSEEPSDTPFSDQVGSGAVLEPVPALEPGLLTADELAPWQRKTGSRVTPTLWWSRAKNDHVRG